MESTGTPFNVLAHTLNVSSTGARIGGVKVQLGVGDAVTIQYKQNRALFKVVWLGRPGDPTQDQIGVALLEQDRQIWSEIQDPERFRDDFTGERSRRASPVAVSPAGPAGPVAAPVEVPVPIEVMEAAEDAPSPATPPQPDRITDEPFVQIEAPVAPRDTDEVVRACARGLLRIEELVKRTPPAPAALHEFRDAIAKVRQTVWALQQWHEVNKEGKTAFPLLAYLNAERLRFVIQATRDLATDREKKGVELDTELLGALFRSVDSLRSGAAAGGTEREVAEEPILKSVKAAISQVQGSGMSPEEAVAYLADEMRRIFSADGLSIARLQEGEMLCLGSSGNAAEAGVVLETESGLGGEAMQSGDLVYCHDTQADPRVDSGLCKEAGIASVVMIPVKPRSGRPIGMLEISSGRAHGFGPAHLDALRQSAAMIAPFLLAQSAMA